MFKFSLSRTRNAHFINECLWMRSSMRYGRSSAVIYINQTDRETKTAVNTYRTTPKRSFVASSTSVHQIERWHCDDSSVSIMGKHKRRAPHVSLVEFTATKAELHRQSTASTIRLLSDSLLLPHCPSSINILDQFAPSSRAMQKFISTPCFPPLMRDIEHIFVSNLQTILGVKRT